MIQKWLHRRGTAGEEVRKLSGRGEGVKGTAGKKARKVSGRGEGEEGGEQGRWRKLIGRGEGEEWSERAEWQGGKRGEGEAGEGVSWVAGKRVHGLVCWVVKNFVVVTLLALDTFNPLLLMWCDGIESISPLQRHLLLAIRFGIPILLIISFLPSTAGVVSFPSQNCALITVILGYFWPIVRQ